MSGDSWSGTEFEVDLLGDRRDGSSPGKFVLLVEDDPVIVEMLRDCLVDYGGFQVLHARTSLEAQEHFDQNVVDGIILDGKLAEDTHDSSEFGGIRVLAYVQQRNFHGPVVAISGVCSKELCARGATVALPKSSGMAILGALLSVL
ncbi:response regulator [Candidatus Kuenenbacteria bacterium]|nr:response regulator [Candidatus Kuenenbacteria bacterium]